MAHRNSTKNQIALQLTALIMAHGLTNGVQAQSAPKPVAPVNTSTNSPAKLPDVVVSGEQEKEPSFKPEALSSPKYTQPLRDTPQTINVIPRSLIDSQGATTLRDVVRNVPGISFQAGEGGVPAGDQMTIRGFSARTDMFVDGVRDVGGYTRDAFNVEQVEVSKGPNSSYSGRGSTGGSINLTSKMPKLDTFYATDLSYGTDQYYRATADINVPIPELSKIGVEGAALRFNGLFHDQDFAGRDYVHDQRWAVAPSLALGLGTDTRAFLSYQHVQENNLAGYGLPFVTTSLTPFGPSAVGHIAPLPYDTFVGLVDRDYEDVYNDALRLRLEHDFNEDLKLRNQTSYVRTYRDSVIASPRLVTISNAQLNNPPFGNNNFALGTDGVTRYGLNHEYQSRDMTDTVIANQTDLTAKFDTGKIGHTLVGSLEYDHETSVNFLRSAIAGTPFPFPAITSNPLNPNPFDPFHPGFRTGAHNEAMADSVGVSAVDTVKLSEEWLVTLGARFDTFDLTYNQYATNGVLTQLQRFDAMPSWRAGLTYKPRPNGSIYFGYATSFNPSAEGLTLAANTSLAEPETSQSYELGTKWDLFSERLSLSGALFSTDKDHYRNADPVTQIVTTSGEVRVQGIELGVAGKLTEHWNVYAGYSLQESLIMKSIVTSTYDGKPVREQGHVLSNTPEQTGNISTTYDLPHGITLGTGFNFVDKRYSNNFETSSVDGYWLQDGMISWKVNERLLLRLNASNLWDAKYIDRVGGGQAIPGVGRTIILTASLRF